LGDPDLSVGHTFGRDVVRGVYRRHFTVHQFVFHIPAGRLVVLRLFLLRWHRDAAPFAADPRIYIAACINRLNDYVFPTYFGRGVSVSGDAMYLIQGIHHYFAVDLGREWIHAN